MNPSPYWGFEWVRRAMEGDGSRASFGLALLGLLFLVPGVLARLPAATIVGAILLAVAAAWTLRRVRATRRARRLSARSRRTGDAP